ncbi:hypothetical protein NMY22_g1081 [Coprinellus aureogranulatus]|nr:hypothetical protein NMY22_g1081 [Coprinellus aureogranulatus]
MQRRGNGNTEMSMGVLPERGHKESLASSEPYSRFVSSMPRTSLPLRFFLDGVRAATSDVGYLKLLLGRTRKEDAHQTWRAHAYVSVRVGPRPVGARGFLILSLNLVPPTYGHDIDCVASFLELDWIYPTRANDAVRIASEGAEESNWGLGRLCGSGGLREGGSNVVVKESTSGGLRCILDLYRFCHGSVDQEHPDVMVAIVPSFVWTVPCQYRSPIHGAGTNLGITLVIPDLYDARLLTHGLTIIRTVATRRSCHLRFTPDLPHWFAERLPHRGTPTTSMHTYRRRRVPLSSYARVGGGEGIAIEPSALNTSAIPVNCLGIRVLVHVASDQKDGNKSFGTTKSAMDTSPMSICSLLPVPYIEQSISEQPENGMSHRHRPLEGRDCRIDSKVRRASYLGGRRSLLCFTFPGIFRDD